jgi:hypothetical protein
MQIQHHAASIKRRNEDDVLGRTVYSVRQGDKQ